MKKRPESHSSINLPFGVVIVDAESDSVPFSAVDANSSNRSHVNNHERNLKKKKKKKKKKCREKNELRPQ